MPDSPDQKQSIPIISTTPPLKDQTLEGATQSQVTRREVLQVAGALTTAAAIGATAIDGASGDRSILMKIINKLSGNKPVNRITENPQSAIINTPEKMDLERERIRREAAVFYKDYPPMGQNYVESITNEVMAARHEDSQKAQIDNDIATKNQLGQYLAELNIGDQNFMMSQYTNLVSGALKIQ